MINQTYPPGYYRKLHFGNNTTRTYDELAQPSDKRGYGAFDYPVFPREADRHIQRVIRHFARPDEAILELGCNAGANILPLAQAGYKIFGIDISTRALDYLNQRIRKEGLSDQAKASQWDFAGTGDLPPEWVQKYGALKDHFKAIYAVHTLSHLSGERLIKTMQKMKEYLAPGGIFIVSIIEPSQNKRPWKTYEDPGVSGYIEHDEETVAKAFQGMKLLEAFSRPFNYRDLINWTLPFDQLHWFVFQKP